MKSVMYLWSTVDAVQLKHQIDAVVAAAVFDTNPFVVVTADVAAKLENAKLEQFDSLAMLDVEVHRIGQDFTKRQFNALLNEVDHVIHF